MDDIALLTDTLRGYMFQALGSKATIIVCILRRGRKLRPNKLELMSRISLFLVLPFMGKERVFNKPLHRAVLATLPELGRTPFKSGL